MNPEVSIKITALDKSSDAFKSLNKNLDQANKSTKGLRGNLENLQPAFKKMATFGLASLTAVTYGANKAITSASDLEESMNAVNVVFGDSADAILKFGKTASTSVGLSNSAFNQLATNTGTVLSNTGKSMDEVAQMTTELAVRSADLASVYNTDVETAMNAIRSALIGQSEPLRNLGVVMSEAQIKAFALSTGIIEVEREMTEQEKTLARYNFIMEQTTKQAGDFANTSDSLANKQRILASQTEDLTAKIGALIAPIKETILNAIGPLIERLSTWIGQNPELARTIILVTVALSALITVLGLVGIALLALNPISIIIVGTITGIIAIVVAVRNAMELFGVTWSAVWEGIKTVAGNAVDYVVGRIQRIIDMVQTALDALASLPGVKQGISITKNAFRGVSDLFRADGGPVSGNTPYIVGERGPELFVPGSKGNIVPNHALAGGRGGTNINLYISGTFLDDRESAKRMGDEIMVKLRQQMQL